MQYQLDRIPGPGKEYQYYGWYDNRPVHREHVYEALFKFFIVFPAAIVVVVVLLYVVATAPALGLVIAWLLLRGR